MSAPAFRPVASRNQRGVRLPIGELTADQAAVWATKGDRAQRRAAQRWLKKHLRRAKATKP